MRFVTFPLDDFDRFGGWDNMPKKELLSVTVNPYNGNVCMKISERRNAAEVIEQVINQLSRDLHLLKMQDADSGISDFADMCDGKREKVRPIAVSMQRKGRCSAAAVDMAKVG